MGSAHHRDRPWGNFSGRVHRLRARADKGGEVVADIGRLLSGAGRRLAAALHRGGVRPPVSDFTHRVETPATWEDLVLPEHVRRQLSDIAASVAGRGRNHPAWEFQATERPGRRVWVESSGAIDSLAVAQVLAAELNVDLYRVDLSSVVSKYIDETEKNLRRLFDSAETGDAVLLFDEADALFGQRSDVRDSHDRYALGTILEAIAEYKGTAIFIGSPCDELDPHLCDLMDDVLAP